MMYQAVCATIRRYSPPCNRKFCLVIMTLCLLLICNTLMNATRDIVEYTARTTTYNETSIVSAVDMVAQCGPICSYDGKVIKDKGVLYPQLEKDVNCTAIMRRMAFQNHTIPYPPPEQPPGHMMEAYTMGGDMPVWRVRYLKDEWKNDKARRYGNGYVTRAIDKVLDGEQVNTYKSSGLCVEQTLKKYTHVINNQHGVVVGTLDPWLESTLLAFGADKVTTLEYGELVLDHPQLEAYTPYAYAERYLRGRAEKFDFGATFSSLEHSGLGRYGDPLNPYGDLEAMAQTWCMIKPGGYFAVGIPYHPRRGYLSWNIHRVYSTLRLKHLTANWEAIELVKCDDIHAFIVLKKSG